MTSHSEAVAEEDNVVHKAETEEVERWRIDAIEMTIELLENCVEGVEVVLKLSLMGTKLLILLRSS
jgi:hypothetical protein